MAAVGGLCGACVTIPIIMAVGGRGDGGRGEGGRGEGGRGEGGRGEGGRGEGGRGMGRMVIIIAATGFIVMELGFTGFVVIFFVGALVNLKNVGLGVAGIAGWGYGCQ